MCSSPRMTPPRLYLEYVTTSWNNVVTRLPAKLQRDGLHQESPTKAKTSLNLAKAVGVARPSLLWQWWQEI